MLTANPPNKPTKNRLATLRRRLRIPEREQAQFNGLVDALSQYLSEPQIAKVHRAFEFGAHAHQGQLRLEGEKYISHPLGVARLLAELKLDAKAIIAAILHDTLEDTPIKKEQISQQFGDDVAELVDGVSKVDKLKFESPQHAEAENLRRMFLAADRDLRVIFIKMADRLHNLGSIHVHRVEKRQRIVAETRDIYIPIANLLGMADWQRKMENLCFLALHPKRYKIIYKASRAGLKQGVGQTINRHKAEIEKMLKQKGIESEVKGRFKEVPAIHDKMRRKGKSLRSVSHLSDLFAFRIIVKDVDDCYRTLGLIHGRYKPISREFNDYIAIPKKNGYQSLHTTVHGTFGRAIEFQIRTKEMDTLAELGIASHLAYKSGTDFAINPQLPYTQLLKEVIRTAEEHETPAQYMANVKQKLDTDYVTVFTPKGEVKTLNKGSTVIDYAYSIDANVGNSAKSARIDDQVVPLHTVLEDGNRVEIVTSRFSRPNPAWLKFVTTNDAKKAIDRRLAEMKPKDMIKIGDRIFRAKLKQYKIKQSDVTKSMKSELATRLNLESWDAILKEIGTGERFAAAVIGQIFPHVFLESHSKSSEALSIRGTEGLGMQYARCCNPIPPEQIVGVFNCGQGIVVHTQDCGAVRNSNLSPDYWQKLIWAQSPKRQYWVPIRVNCKNEKGVLAEVASRVASSEADVGHVKIIPTKPDAVLELEIEVKNTEHLNTILKRIRRHPMVNGVERIKLNK